MSLTPLGILHTLVGMGAVFIGFFLLWKYKQIRFEDKLAKVYLVLTLITAASALGIFNHGGFNDAHTLAILTILAVIAGTIASVTSFLGGLKKYFVALCFSGTILFHALPTTTEILTRFPVDAPLVDSLKHPLLLKTFGVIVVIFLIGLVAQMLWLRKQES